MTRTVRTILRRFRRDEDGAAPVIEFVIMFPILIFLLLSAFELSIYAFRQNWLDRGLDLAVRDIRLNTGQNYTHTQVKAMICEKSGFLQDCNAHLKLEMNPVDPRGFVAFEGGADCVDTAQPLAPSRSFVHGAEHSLMILRACYLYDPVFPRIGMGEAMTKDGNEYYPLIAVSVFVQEPSS
ncbi:TadE/TadG family type IV pilus assembly protein [uncultured Tateyamaria sp.]|uniref:TadE/TadG family type IV pilus assembly protein n=1 Tax=Tateyamaria sp. 1078 TaxID=3417464 RepID=UPI002623EE80|nr:TadE/TadG family type IV pilus assembly protein [uncultured Tateyamaria sp.]